jgi:hypothetical protein
MQAEQTGPSDEQRPQLRVPTARALELSPRELDALDTLAPLVTASPRRAKRFLNVYRIVRARSMMDDGRRSLRDDGALVALLVLVALAVGLPDSAPEILEHTDPESEPTLASWLGHYRDDLIGQADAKRRVNEFIARCGPLQDVELSDILQWIPVVRPFAWPRPERRGIADWDVRRDE